MEEEKYAFSEATDKEVTTTPVVEPTPVVESAPVVEEPKKKDPRNIIIVILFIIIIILAAVAAVLYLTKDKRNKGNDETTTTTTVTTEEITTRKKENIVELPSASNTTIDPIEHTLKDGYTNEEHYTYKLNGNEHKIDVYYYEDTPKSDNTEWTGHKVLLIDGKTYPPREFSSIKSDMANLSYAWNGEVETNQNASGVINGEDGKDYYVLSLIYKGAGSSAMVSVINDKNQIIFVMPSYGFYQQNDNAIYGNGYIKIEDDKFRFVVPANNETATEANELIGTVFENKVTIEKVKTITDGTFAGMR